MDPDRFDDVSVVASYDESPAPPQRRARRAVMTFAATAGAFVALTGAALALSSEKDEAAATKAAAAAKSSVGGHHKGECRRGLGRRSDSSSLRY